MARGGEPSIRVRAQPDLRRAASTNLHDVSLLGVVIVIPETLKRFEHPAAPWDDSGEEYRRIKRHIINRTRPRFRSGSSCVASGEIGACPPLDAAAGFQCLIIPAEDVFARAVLTPGP